MPSAKVSCDAGVADLPVYFRFAGRDAEVVQAYELRAPGQKGIHFKVWGSLMGQMLLRSMDRAEVIYESMCLRGFDGVFRLKKRYGFVPGMQCILFYGS